MKGIRENGGMGGSEWYEKFSLFSFSLSPSLFLYRNSWMVVAIFFSPGEKVGNGKIGYG